MCRSPPAGLASRPIKGGTAFELSLQAKGRLTTPEEFGDIIVSPTFARADRPPARRRAGRARRAGLQHQRLSFGESTVALQ